jgi:hypothetical protein
MSNFLTPEEARVIACLVEKQITTPDYYPMTLNALTAACNQKTNRDPVVSYDETTVLQALDGLSDKYLIYALYPGGSRVAKYKHSFGKIYELDDREIALVCTLLLRGAQTIGELRERGSRMFLFSSLGEVSEALDNLAAKETPLVVKLPRQAGQKEIRYAHLLCGEIDVENYVPERVAAAHHADNERVSNLEQEVETLKSELANLRQKFEEFKKQFE